MSGGVWKGVGTGRAVRAPSGVSAARLEPALDRASRSALVALRPGTVSSSSELERTRGIRLSN